VGIETDEIGIETDEIIIKLLDLRAFANGYINKYLHFYILLH
jgi:hypothetical protein